MKQSKFISISIATVLSAAILMFAAAPVNATLLWDGNATNGTGVFKNLNLEDANGNAQANPTPNGSSITTATDSTYGPIWVFNKASADERAEAHGAYGVNPAIGSTYYIGWRSKLSSLVDDNANFQWKAYGSNFLQNFPIWLKMKGGKWEFSYQPPNQPGVLDEVYTTTIATNVWYTHVLLIHVSDQESAGYMEYWFNGQHVTFTNGSTRLPGRTFDGTSVDPKWGIYGAVGTPFINRICNLKIGTTYADVAPSSPDFSISTTPSSQNITIGSNTTYAVSVSALNNFSGSVALTASGLPTGASATFNPTSISSSGTSTLTVTTSTNTSANTYTLTVTGTSGSLVHSNTVTLVLADFSISASPASQTVTAGGGTNYTVTVGNINGFGGTVTFSASGLPSGATASFVPTSVTTIGSSTLTVATTANTPAGSSTLTVKGTSGNLIHTAATTLVVILPPAAAPTFSPGAGTYTSAQTVTISTTTGGASIRYTTDGSTPSETAGTLYSSPVTISATTTLKAIAYESGYTDSSVSSAVYTINTSSGGSTNNLALNRPATASSIWSASYAASNAVDGNTATRWSAASGQTSNQWLLVDLGNATNYGSVVIMENSYQRVTAFQIQSSADGANFITQASGMTIGTNLTVSFPTVSARYVRLYINSATNVPTINEFQVYSSSSFSGTYEIQNVASGQALNQAGSMTNGSAISQWNWVSSINEEWQFIPTSNGYYQIQSLKSGLDVAVQGANTTNGTPLIQWSYGSSGDDQWKPVQNSDGTWTFYNLNSGLVMNSGGSTNQGAQYSQWSWANSPNEKFNLIQQ